MSAVVSEVTKNRAGILKVFQGSPIMGPLAALIIASIFFLRWMLRQEKAQRALEAADWDEED